jgi:hypothetical protein
VRPQAAAAAAIAAAAIVTAGCSSSSSSARPHVTARQAARQRGIAAARALNPARTDATTRPVPRLRLGILATPAATTGLAALDLGYIAARLAPSGTQLDTTAYTSPAAEAAALTAGAIDAAYTTPAAALTAWQHSHHGIRIIAGATDTATGTPAVILAARASYLTSHKASITALLQGQIQAVLQLTTNPAAAIPAARAELQALLHQPVTVRAAAALTRYRSTASPGPAPDGTSALLNLTPLNTLLKASGLPPAS